MGRLARSKRRDVAPQPRSADALAALHVGIPQIVLWWRILRKERSLAAFFFGALDTGSNGMQRDGRSSDRQCASLRGFDEAGEPVCPIAPKSSAAATWRQSWAGVTRFSW